MEKRANHLKNWEMNTSVLLTTSLQISHCCFWFSKTMPILENVSKTCQKCYSERWVEYEEQRSSWEEKTWEVQENVERGNLFRNIYVFIGFQNCVNGLTSVNKCSWRYVEYRKQKRKLEKTWNVETEHIVSKENKTLEKDTNLLFTNVSVLFLAVQNCVNCRKRANNCF